MSATLSLIKIEPLGYRYHDSASFVDGKNLGGLRRISYPIYPPSANGYKLSGLRRGQLITLREAATLLGLRPSELSGLELGQYGLSESDWQSVFTLLGEKKKPSPSLRKRRYRL